MDLGIVGLRPLAPSDLDALVDLDADPEVMRHITGGLPTPREVYVQWLLPRMLGAAVRPGMGFFVVEEAGRFLGWAHLRPDTVEPAWAEVGYRLRRAAWGRGIATVVARALMDRAFHELDADVVSARTIPANGASRRVMEKLGMRLSGTFTVPARDLGPLRLPALDGVLYLRRRADGVGIASPM